jgi:hypothetical protein
MIVEPPGEWAADHDMPPGARLKMRHDCHLHCSDTGHKDASRSDDMSRLSKLQLVVL